MQLTTLKKTLDQFYKTYHDPVYLGLDPLEFVHRFKGSANKEIGGLICSALAYGRVEQIRKSITTVLNSTGMDLDSFCKKTSYREKKKLFKGMKHRFNTGTDIAILFEIAGNIATKYGSVAAMFKSLDNEKSINIKQALHDFSLTIRAMARVIEKSNVDTFDFFFPAPGHGSTCKRLNMYLRWMARPCDGIDLGVWKHPHTSRLIIPVDTHVAKIAAQIGLSKRTTIDWKMAEEITANLRQVCPGDPVKYDFSICHSGMVEVRARTPVQVTRACK